jgi:sensor histidine kinase YesM
MKALYSYETSETGNDIASNPCRSESAATWLLSYVPRGYRCYRGYIIYQILTVVRVALFINVTGILLVCLITFAVIVSLVTEAKIHFLFILFPIVHTMLWIIRSPQKYFAYGRILILEYFRLMWIIYEDSQ